MDIISLPSWISVVSVWVERSKAEVARFVEGTRQAQSDLVFSLAVVDSFPLPPKYHKMVSTRPHLYTSRISVLMIPDTRRARHGRLFVGAKEVLTSFIRLIAVSNQASITACAIVTPFTGRCLPHAAIARHNTLNMRDDNELSNMNLAYFP